jgi:nucleoside-diphosphate-sugar epimerase
MRKYIVVFGAAGFIGSKLMQWFHSNGTSHVIAVDKGMFGFNHIKQYDRIERFFNCSLYSFLDNYEEILKETRCVIHIGGLSNDPMADFNPSANSKYNFEDTLTLLGDLIRYEVPRFIFASSASIYGLYDDKLVNEIDQPQPNSAYAQAKVQSENAILSQCENTKTCPIILRKATVMGVSPRMRFDLVVNTMVMTAIRFGKISLYGGGENWRPLVSINDVVRLYSILTEIPFDTYKRLAHEIYNVVQENYRISELGLRIGKMLDVSVIPDYDKSRDKRSYRMDGIKLTSNLGFECEHDLEKTVFNVRRWITQNKPDLDDPIYSNIKWLKNCERVCATIGMKYSL